MVKLIQLDTKQQILLSYIIKWIESTYSQHGYVLFNSRWRTVGEYLETLKKILVLNQYTPEEQHLLNEVRSRYLKQDLGVDDLPF